MATRTMVGSQRQGTLPLVMRSRPWCRAGHGVLNALLTRLPSTPSKEAPFLHNHSHPNRPPAGEISQSEKGSSGTAFGMEPLLSSVLRACADFQEQ